MVDSVNPKVAELVVGKPSGEPNSSVPLFTPALSQILESYATNGSGDRTLLLAILKAKAEEDKVSVAVSMSERQVPEKPREVARGIII